MIGPFYSLCLEFLGIHSKGDFIKESSKSEEWRVQSGDLDGTIILPWSTSLAGDDYTQARWQSMIRHVLPSSCFLQIFQASILHESYRSLCIDLIHLPSSSSLPTSYFYSFCLGSVWWILLLNSNSVNLNGSTYSNWICNNKDRCEQHTSNLNTNAHLTPWEKLACANL